MANDNGFLEQRIKGWPIIGRWELSSTLVVIHIHQGNMSVTVLTNACLRELGKVATSFQNKQVHDLIKFCC